MQFTHEEGSIAVGELHGGKAACFDGITAKHVKYDGDTIISVLVLLFNDV